MPLSFALCSLLGYWKCYLLPQLKSYVNYSKFCTSGPKLPFPKFQSHVSTIEEIGFSKFYLYGYLKNQNVSNRTHHVTICPTLSPPVPVFLHGFLTFLFMVPSYFQTWKLKILDSFIWLFCHIFPAKSTLQNELTAHWLPLPPLTQVFMISLRQHLSLL